MSLDVSLHLATPFSQDTTPQIWIREAGQQRRISRAEWDARCPDREPVTATPPADTTEVYHANITHNLVEMAQAAGLYAALWRPEAHGLTHAHHLMPLLTAGLARLQADPAVYAAYEAPNGWGTYPQLCQFVADYLSACEQWPAARVEVWR